MPPKKQKKLGDPKESIVSPLYRFEVLLNSLRVYREANNNKNRSALKKQKDLAIHATSRF